jgi:hypothetical protein
MVAATSFSSPSAATSGAVRQTHLVAASSTQSGGAATQAEIHQEYTTFEGRADWSRPIIERLEWATDVLTAHDGTEQRIKLRELPRREIEMAMLMTGRERRSTEALIYGHGAAEFCAPIWHQLTRTTAPVMSGDYIVPVVTEHLDFYAGGLAFIAGVDFFDVFEIDSVSPTQIVSKQKIDFNIPMGAEIMPAAIARFTSGQTAFSRFTGDVSYGVVRLSLNDAQDTTPATEATYRGVPVLVDKPNWIEDIDAEFSRKLAEIDFGTGVRRYYDESGMPEIVQSHRRTMTTRTEIAGFRAWLYARAGRYAALWVPTWANDLIVTATIGAAAVIIDIEHTYYVRHMAQALHRRDIRIQLASGAVYYRRITASAEIDATTERLTIDSALGLIVQPADVVMVSFMAISRMDSDGVEIAYFTGDIAEASHPVRAIRYDV